MSEAANKAKALRKKFRQLKDKMAAKESANIMGKAQEINGVKFLSQVLKAQTVRI